jgi:hypothetical protein
MKKGTAAITTKAVVKSVQNYIKLTDDEITKILDDNQDKLNLTQKQEERWHKKCLCLVEFECVTEIETLKFEHQNNMDDWLILEKIDDVIEGTSITYNYNSSKLK